MKITVAIFILIVLPSWGALCKVRHPGGGKQGPASVTLVVSPNSIAPGASATLTWSSQNANGCIATGGFSTSGALSGSVSVSPITTTIYGFSCSNDQSVASTVATITVSQTNVVNADGNCDGPHAGTPMDPFPFDCVVQAINGLPSGGGTVIVGNGTWQQSTSGNQVITRGNFNLVGQSLSADIVFVGNFQVWIMDNVSNVSITNLTLDGTSYTGFLNPLRLSGVQNSVLANNTMISVQNTALALVLVEGGSGNGITNNIMNINPITGGYVGVQLNPLGGTPNSGFLYYGNTLNSQGLLVIGINAALIYDNNENNTELGNSLGFQTATNLGTPGTNGSDGITIDNNVIDATTGSPNGALISQIPQDPGTTTDVYDLTISNNTVKGTGASINLQDYEDSCLATCTLPNTFNSKIINNTIISTGRESYISIRGGTNGTVQGVVVAGNVISGSATGQILTDAHTFNAILFGNSL